MIYRNVITDQVNSFKSMNVDRALKQLRFINFLLGLVVIVVEIFGIFGTIFSNPAAIILNGFCVLFCFILCLYELQLKRLSKKLRKSYGFLYTYIGRALYIFLFVFGWVVML